MTKNRPTTIKKTRDRDRIRKGQQPAETPESSRIILFGFLAMFICIGIGAAFTTWNSPCSAFGRRVRNSGCLLRYRDSAAAVGFYPAETAWVYSTNNYVIFEDIATVREQEPTRSLPLEHAEGLTVEHFALSADQTHIAISLINIDATERSLVVWNVDERQRVLEMPLSSNNRLQTIAADGSHVVVTRAQEARLFYEVASGDLVAELGVIGVNYAPDNSLFATTITQTLALRDPTTFETVRTIETDVENDLACPTWSPDGRYLAVGDIGALRIIDVESDDVVFRLPDSDKVHFCAFTFSADSTRLAITTYTPGRSDADVTIYDIASGSALQTINTRYTFPLDIAYSAERQLLAVGGAQTTYLIDLEASR